MTRSGGSFKRPRDEGRRDSSGHRDAPPRQREGGGRGRGRGRGGKGGGRQWGARESRGEPGARRGLTSTDADSSEESDVEDDVSSQRGGSLPVQSAHDDALDADDSRSIRELERKLGLSTGGKKRSGGIKRLNREFAEEGLGDDFGSFLDDLDRVIGGDAEGGSGGGGSSGGSASEGSEAHSSDGGGDSDGGSDGEDGGEGGLRDEYGESAEDGGAGDGDSDASVGGSSDGDDDDEPRLEAAADSIFDDDDDEEEEDDEGGVALRFGPDGRVDVPRLCADLGTKRLPRHLVKVVRDANRSVAARRRRVEILSGLRAIKSLLPAPPPDAERKPRGSRRISWGDKRDGGSLELGPSGPLSQRQQRGLVALGRRRAAAATEVQDSTPSTEGQPLRKRKRLAAASAAAAALAEAEEEHGGASAAPPPEEASVGGASSGHSTSGGDLAAAAAARLAQFAPPHRRSGGSGSALSPSDAAALKRRLQGVLNRLTEASLEPLSGEVGALYRTYPTAEVTSALLALVESACGHETQVLPAVTMSCAGLLAALHITVGPSVGAAAVERLTLAFAAAAALPLEANPSQVAVDASAPFACGWLAGTPDAPPAKLRANLLLVLTYLFIFHTASAPLLAQLLTLLVARFAEADVELFLEALRHGGFALRSEDPAALRDVLKAAHGRVKAALAAGGEGEPLSRMRFLGEVVLDLKNNRVRSEVAQVQERGLQLRKWLNRVAARTAGLDGTDRRVRLGWGDLMDIPERGRWWVVGASWAGRAAAGEASLAGAPVRLSGAPVAAAATAGALSTEGGGVFGASAPRSATGLLTGASVADPAAAVAGGSGGSEAGHLSARDAALLELARAMRMNTPTRRAVFVALMGADDVEGAVDRALRLSLKGAAEREIVRVAIDCAAQEVAYNPFYGAVGARLCTLFPRFRFTFQLALWDAFKTFAGAEDEGGVEGGLAASSGSAATPRRVYNLARLCADLMLRGALSLAVLKPLPFTGGTRASVLFLKALFSALLLRAPAPRDVALLFSRLGAGADRLALRDGIAVFLHSFVSAKALARDAPSPADADALAEKLRAAKKALEAVGPELLGGED